MDSKEFESKMRALEHFHSLRIVPDTYTIIRVDGRAFSSFTRRYHKPFDPLFRDKMVATAHHLLVSLEGLYAYTQSDEISVLLPKEYDLFDGEVEKLVSVSAGMASGVFSTRALEAVAFDARIIVATDADTVVDYFRWRQSDCARNALEGYCYWTLRKDGQSQSEATRALLRTGVTAKHDILLQKGINFTTGIPEWEKRGVGLRWDWFPKVGHNPITHTDVSVLRRRVYTDFKLPTGDAYGRYTRDVLSGVGASEYAGGEFDARRTSEVPI